MKDQSANVQVVLRVMTDLTNAVIGVAHELNRLNNNLEKANQVGAQAANPLADIMGKVAGSAIKEFKKRR